MTPPPIVAASPAPSPFRVLVGAACAGAALFAAWWRADLTVLPAGTSVSAATLLGLVFVGVAVAVRARRGRLEPMLLVMIAAGAALLLSGLVELPKWPSIEAVGRTILFFPLTLGAAAVGWVAAAGRGRTAADAGLAMFVLFTACGGPLFVRVADERFALLILFAAPVMLALPHGLRGFLSVPFARLGAALLTVAALAALTTVDLDRHLHGVVRLGLALVPLAVLGVGAPDPGRAWFVTRAFGWSVVVSLIAAALAVGEVVGIVGTRLGFDVRLTLFGEHPNIVAPFFAVAPPLLLALARKASSARGRIGWSLVAALTLFALLLPRSRAAALGAVVGLASYGLLAVLPALRRRFGGRRLAAAAGVLALAATGAALAGSDLLRAQLETDAMRFRTTIWSTAADAIAARPWTGYGFLTGDPLMVHATPGELDGRSKDTHPHAVPLAIALGAGVPAALLFLAWVVLFLVRTGRVAARARDPSVRGLAAGVAASALALLAANLLDQGLSMHTPIALHLGLLVGLGALLVRASAGVAPAPADATPRPSRVRVALGHVALALAATFAVLSMVAERWMQTAYAESRRRHDDEALALAARATAIEPFSLDLGLRRVDLLVRADEPRVARGKLERLARLHPLSWEPWEKLSTLEFREGNLAGAQAALERARALDPTGPLDAVWHLRTSKIRARQGRLDDAFEAMARAFRFDHEAVVRVPWKEVEEAGAARDLYVEIEEMGGSIRLSSVLERNRRAMRAALEGDAVAARRMAMVLVKGYGFLTRYDEARAVIDEFEARSGTTWLPMTYLRMWLDRKEAEEHGAELPATAAAAAAAAPELTRVAGVAGEAGVRMERGQGLLASGDPAGAVEAFQSALDVVYGIVAEKEYVALVFDGLVDAYLELGEYAAMETALERALYFLGDPARRIERLASVAVRLTEDGRREDALSTLGDAAEAARFLAPTPDAREALRALGDALTPFADGGAVDAIARAEGTPPALLLEARRLNDLGRPVESRRLFAEFEGRYPEWSRRAQ